VSNFFTQYLADFQQVSASTGINVSVIMAQVADETGTGGSHAFNVQNNWAGVSVGGGVNSFPTKAAGLDAYISALNHPTYNPVRQAVGWHAQAVALGASPWAAAHYDAADYFAAGQPADGTWTPPNPGIDLIDLIQENNLTRFDGAQAQNVAPSTAGANAALAALPTIAAPPLGLTSDVAVGNFFINGTSIDIAVSGAVITAQLDLSLTQASTFTLTLHDPDQVILNSGLFSERAVVNFGSTALSFSLVSVAPQGTVLTVEFEAYVVAALRTATGPITTAAGQMTRTDFAKYLVAQIEGALFNSPPPAWLFAQNDGYDRPTQEQISRGTSDSPLEDSWTCLQRLATEINWVCFEDLGVVYFGPESYLAQQAPVMVPVRGQGGIDSIDGTYDVGQPQGELTITATADQWIGQIGNAVSITAMGPLNGPWLISEISRRDVEEPEITITIVQPQPNLPEPKSGGAAAAVGAGDNSANAASQQTAGGSKAALAALALAVQQIGKPYIWGGENPATGFDCSGLVQWCYANQDISIPRTTFSQWDAGQAGQIAKVPAGIGNLRGGDLVYFAGGDGTANSPGHVAMVHDIKLGTNTVIVVDAFETGVPIRYDHFGYVNPGGNTDFAGTYVGALRPAT
jgi:cell wall-associated NlpC family hydrolase